MPDETRRVRIKVEVESDTRGSADAAKGLEQVDTSAQGATKSLGGLGEQSRKLDAELAKSKARVKELRLEFAQTTDMKVFGDLRKEETNLRRLEKVAKGIASDIKEAAGPGILSSIFEGASGGNTGPAKVVLIGGIIAAAATAAPALGAMIAGAVAGTTVGGGILGGVIAASNDSRVRSAFQDLTSNFTAEAFGGAAFVGPVVKGIHILRDAFNDLDIGDTLALGAASVPILARGIADLVTNLMPGFNKVMDQAEAFTVVFADGLAGTGAALSDFFESIMSNEGTIEGLHAGFKILSQVIIGTGNVLEFLAKAFHKSMEAGAAFTGAMEDLVGWIPFLGDGMRWANDTFEETLAVGFGAGRAIHKMGDETDRLIQAGEEAKDVWKAFNDELARTIELQAAYMIDQLDVEQGLQDLANQFDENGTDLSRYTDEGRENQRALIELARQMRELRDDQIAMGEGTAEANAALEANHQRLLDQAEAAGLSRAAIEELIGWMFKVPKINFGGTARTYGPSDSTFGGGLQEFASGGITPAFEPFRVHDGEVMFSDRPHYVATRSQVNAMSGGGTTQSTAPASLNLYGGGLGQVVFEWLRTEIAAKGGTLAVLGLRAS